jgi:hypothetical protein
MRFLFGIRVLEIRELHQSLTQFLRIDSVRPLVRFYEHNEAIGVQRMRAIEMIESDYFGIEFAGFVTGAKELTVVRRSDLAMKVVKGHEARLADELCHETGREIDWDAILEKLSGRWTAPKRSGFAVSTDGRWLAF